VPSNVNKIGAVEDFCVDPSYHGLKLDSALIKESMKLCRSRGVQYLLTVCVTDAHRDIFAELGFSIQLEYPLANFYDGDAAVFKQLPNEKTDSRLSLMVTKLEE